MKKQNNTFQQAIVGLFMITLLGLLAYFTIVISGVDLLSGRNRQPMHIVFDHVGGLKEHDNVMYRGTKVGTVERVYVTPTNLVVMAMVDPGVIVRESYCASVGSLSMLGGNYLVIEEGEGAIIDYSRTRLRGQTPTDWMRDVAEIASNIKRITASAEVKSMLTNFSAMSASARRICDRADLVVTRIERGEGTVGKFLSTNDTLYADAVATVAEARQSMGDIKAAFANAKSISERLNRDQTYTDLEQGIAAFRKAAEGFDSKATMEKANQLLDNLNALAADLRSGKGTLGKLANDPKLYNEVNGLINDVRQVIDNYRDTTPISTFSSLAVGAF